MDVCALSSMNWEVLIKKLLTNDHPHSESHERQDGQVQDQVDVDDDGCRRHER